VEGGALQAWHSRIPEIRRIEREVFPLYEEHFNLAATPFALTPNPRFLYQGESHREALAALVYGVSRRRGFTCLIGEVGTGKSILIQALLEQLDVSMRTAVISHTTLDRDEILMMIARGFQLEYKNLSRVELLAGLADFVLEENRSRQPPPVLIIDEAQNLLGEVLEEIRLITNMEVSNDKLVQVILAGQPELEQKLAHPSLRQLRQRIAVKAKLKPLCQAETASYIAHRLKVVGCADRDLFSEGAQQIIYDASGGVPRVINVLCEQSLVNAFGAGLEHVDELRAIEAVSDIGLLPPRSRRRQPQEFPKQLQLRGLDSLIA
jgi:general secretion pathway protein A